MQSINLVEEEKDNKLVDQVVTTNTNTNTYNDDTENTEHFSEQQMTTFQKKQNQHLKFVSKIFLTQSSTR